MKELEQYGLWGYFENILIKLGGETFADTVLSIISFFILFTLISWIWAWIVLPIYVRQIRNSQNSINAQLSEMKLLAAEQAKQTLYQTELLERIAGIAGTDEQLTPKKPKLSGDLDPEFVAWLQEQSADMKKKDDAQLQSIVSKIDQ